MFGEQSIAEKILSQSVSLLGGLEVVGDVVVSSAESPGQFEEPTFEFFAAVKVELVAVRVGLLELAELIAFEHRLSSGGGLVEARQCGIVAVA